MVSLEKDEKMDPVLGKHLGDIVIVGDVIIRKTMCLPLPKDFAFACLTSLCGVEKAQEAVSMAPQYNDVNEPKYFDINNRRTLRFGRSLEENLKGWWTDFDSVREAPKLVVIGQNRF